MFTVLNVKATSTNLGRYFTFISITCKLQQCMHLAPFFHILAVINCLRSFGTNRIIYHVYLSKPLYHNQMYLPFLFKWILFRQLPTQLAIEWDKEHFDPSMVARAAKEFSITMCKHKICGFIDNRVKEFL